MRVGSVCSGIGAPEAAWKTLGWDFRWASEIEAFPSAVFTRHNPHTPNLGDMTQFKEWPDDPVDLLVGGTPCQSFSVAGLRKGLDDPRGNLALTYLAIADRYRPRWLVWENVPGVLSSNKGRDFGSFLGALGKLGYGWSYRVLDAQYVRVDSHPRAVPQRRRRVFVVGHLGDWRRAAAVLFERESLSGNPAPRRETGPGVARSLTSSTGGCCGKEQQHTFIRGNAVPLNDLNGSGHALNATSTAAGYMDPTVEDYVAHTLRGEGFDASEDGTGRGTPLVPVAFHGSQDPDISGDVTHPVGRNQGLETCVAFSCKDDGRDATDKGSAPTLRSMNGVLPNGGGQLAVAIQERATCENPDARPDGVGVRDDGAAYTLESRQVPQSVAFSIMPMNSGTDYKARPTDVAQPLMAGGPAGGNQGGDFIAASGGSSRSYVADTLTVGANQTTGFKADVVDHGMSVRRLTPRECERLQGFPDDFTRIPWRGKDAADCPDGPRYKALGNSMAVNVMRWIGQRIQAVEDVT